MNRTFTCERQKIQAFTNSTLLCRSRRNFYVG